MNSQFNDLPNPDLFNSFVTWPGLEDALKGIRQELSDQTRPKSPMAVSKPLSEVCLYTPLLLDNITLSLFDTRIT